MNKGRVFFKLGVLGLGPSAALCGGNHELDLLDNLNPSKDRYMIRKSKDLLVCYDSRSRNPLYVLEHLHRSNYIPKKFSKRPNFFVENVIDDNFRVRFFLIHLLI
jgi:DNA/RNA endonuclease G (NUC1)